MIKNNKVLIDNLPDNWKELGAQKFSCSISKIEKVVYGTRQNTDIFEYMLTLAEAEKQRLQNLDSRLNALAE